MTANDPRDASGAPAPETVAAARRRARRTALVLAAIALVIYGGFILTGVLSR